MEKSLDAIRRQIASELLKEIRDRLTFLLNVGLHYLTLDRSAPTLSGGEAQRIRLAGQIGSGLVGVLYILDEPIHRPAPTRQRTPAAQPGTASRHGQHGPRRRARRRNDAGGRLPRRFRSRARAFAAARSSPPASLAKSLRIPRASPAKYLTGELRIEIPKKRRPRTGKVIRIDKARHHNLKNINVEISSGTVCLRHRRQRVWEEFAGQRNPAGRTSGSDERQRGGSRTDRRGVDRGIGADRRRPLRSNHRRREHRQSDRHRSVADRSDAAVESGNVHQGLR